MKFGNVDATIETINGAIEEMEISAETYANDFYRCDAKNNEIDLLDITCDYANENDTPIYCRLTRSDQLIVQRFVDVPTPEACVQSRCDCPVCGKQINVF